MTARLHLGAETLEVDGRAGVGGIDGSPPSDRPDVPEPTWYGRPATVVAGQTLGMRVDTKRGGGAGVPRLARESMLEAARAAYTPDQVAFVERLLDHVTSHGGRYGEVGRALVGRGAEGDVPRWRVDVGHPIASGHPGNGALAQPSRVRRPPPRPPVGALRGGGLRNRPARRTGTRGRDRELAPVCTPATRRGRRPAGRGPGRPGHRHVLTRSQSCTWTIDQASGGGSHLVRSL